VGPQYWRFSYFRSRVVILTVITITATVTKIGVTTVTMEIAPMIAGVTRIGIGAHSLRDQTDVAVAIVLGDKDFRGQ
jgi:hypothetical protein